MAKKITPFPARKPTASRGDFAAAVQAFGDNETDAPPVHDPDISWLQKAPPPRPPLPPKNLPSFTGTYVGKLPWTEPGLVAPASVIVFEREGVQIGFIVKDSMTGDMVPKEEYTFSYYPRGKIIPKEDISHLEGAEFKMEYHSPQIAGHFESFKIPPTPKGDFGLTIKLV